MLFLWEREHLEIGQQVSFGVLDNGSFRVSPFVMRAVTHKPQPLNLSPRDERNRLRILSQQRSHQRQNMHMLSGGLEYLKGRRSQEAVAQIELISHQS